MTLCSYLEGLLLLFFTLQVDRSPTGSGVTARIAVQFHKKLIQLGKIIFHVVTNIQKTVTSCIQRQG